MIVTSSYHQCCHINYFCGYTCVDGNCWLPIELWRKIIGLVIGNHDLLAYKKIQKVCHLFKDIIKTMICQPKPAIYLDAYTCYRLRITPIAQQNITSYRNILMGAGMSSSVAKELVRLFGGCLRINHVLVMTHIGFYWFQINDILSIPPSTNVYECKLGMENILCHTFCVGGFRHKSNHNITTGLLECPVSCHSIWWTSFILWRKCGTARLWTVSWIVLVVFAYLSFQIWDFKFLLISHNVVGSINRSKIDVGDYSSTVPADRGRYNLY